MEPSACSFRPAFKDELPRARHLFPGAPKDSISPLAWFVAVRETPVERIVAALWCRNLPRAACVEFDWTTNGSLAEKDLVAFFAAWRAELEKFSAPPVSLRLNGWHLADLAPERKLAPFGVACAAEEKTLWAAPLEALLDRLPPLSTDDFAIMRPLAPADFPAVRRFAESRALFESHELLEGLQAAAGATPSLFDPRTSVAAFDGSEIVGLCLSNYTTAVARVCALSSIASLDRSLLRLALERLREHGRVAHVLFDCSLDDAFRAELGLVSAGVFRRCSIAFSAV